MADIAALSAALDRLQADVTRMAADLTALKSKPGGINPADLDAPIAKLNAMSDAIEAADPVPPAPPTSA